MLTTSSFEPIKTNISGIIFFSHEGLKKPKFILSKRPRNQLPFAYSDLCFTSKDLKTHVCLIYLLDQGVSTCSDMSGEVCGGEVPKTVGTFTPGTPVYSPWGRLDM